MLVLVAQKVPEEYPITYVLLVLTQVSTYCKSTQVISIQFVRSADAHSVNASTQSIITMMMTQGLIDFKLLPYEAYQCHR